MLKIVLKQYLLMKLFIIKGILQRGKVCCHLVAWEYMYV